MISLSGKQTFQTNDGSRAYRVISGNILIYFYASLDNGQEVKHYLLEAIEGQTVPGLYYQKTVEQKNVTLSLIFSSEDGAELEETESTDEIRQDFLECFQITPEQNVIFEEAFSRYCVSEIQKKYWYYKDTQTVDEGVNEQILQEMVQVFNLKPFEQTESTAQSHHELYDAAARICNWMRIHIIPFAVLKEYNGDDFNVSQIAALSGFSNREILLEEGWYKKEIGPVLAVYGEDHQNVAVIPKSGHGYTVWFPQTNETISLTKEVAANIWPKAQMFYRNFPAESMDLKSLYAFALKDLYASDVAAVLLLALLGTVIGLFLPTVNEKIYDLFIPMGDSAGLIGVCGVLIACTLGNVGFEIVKSFTNFRCFNRMKYAVQAASFARLFTLPDSFFRKFETAELAGKVFSAGQIFDVLQKHVLLTAFSTLFSLFYLYKMHSYSKEMTKAGIIVLLIIVGIILLLGIFQLKQSRRRIKNQNKQASILYQLISGIQKLRIAGAELRGLGQYMSAYEKTVRSDKAINVLTAHTQILSLSMSLVSSIVFYYLMIRKDMDLSVGAFMAFTSAFGAFSNAMMQLGSSIVELETVTPCWEELQPILETVPEIDTHAQIPGELKGEINVDHVTFGYTEDKPVIEEMNLHVRPGEYLGIVGSSGCGKSTLLRLLLGFETAQVGKVYYDGYDIDDLNKRELRKQFGVVLQNGDVISGTIYENITITDPSVSKKEVDEAVKAVGLEDDIKNMPMGLFTMLSEGGGGISGGQRQRILIARAIVSKPKILFFDEATSALDNRTQELICDTIEQLSCTKIVIAHRLTTIMNCDRIIVMDAGKIVEEGTYQELMNRRGLFYELAIRQVE